MAYNLLKPVQVFTAASMATTLTSAATDIRLQDNVGIQLDFTGVPVGTFAIQVSINHLEDMEGNILVAGNWITLILTPAPIAAGAGNDIYIDLNQLSAAYIRIIYTATSGTGILNAYVIAKGV